MRRNPIFVLGTVLTWSVLVAAQGSAPTSDPIVGTWKVNVAKSTYNPGPPPPPTIATLRQYSTMDGGWIRFVQTNVTQQGDPAIQVGVFKVDGQRHPVHNLNTMAGLMTTGKPTNVVRSYRRIDAYSTEFITYTDGVASNPSVRTVAKDGKSFSETTKGKNAQGQEFNNVVVYERVH